MIQWRNRVKLQNRLDHLIKGERRGYFLGMLFAAQKKHFKKLMLTIGLCVFVAAGYMTMSVQTSCKAVAQTCCAPEPCTSPAGGMVTQLGIIGGWSITSIGIAYGTVTFNFTQAVAAFGEGIGAKIFEAQQNIVKWWDEFWFYNLRPAMQAMTVQLNVSDADQSRVLGSFGDAMDMNRTNLALMQSEIESHRALRPSENECVAATVSGGMARAAAIRKAYNAAAPVEALRRSNNETGTPGAGGSGEDLSARWATYVERYCDPGMNAGNAGCAAPGAFAGRDLDIAGEIFSKDTIDVRDADVKRIVDDMVMNLAEPFVPNPVPASVTSAAEGREYLMELNAYKTKRQVVYDALYHIVSRRVPGGTAMGEFIRAMREQTPSAGTSGLDGSYISDSPSHNEIMEVMMSERFRTGTYGTEQVTEPEANGREAVIQQAFMAISMSDTLDLIDKYSLLLAAEIGDQTRLSKTPEGAPIDATTRSQ